jgi:DNA-binding response OmpR family regulator
MLILAISHLGGVMHGPESLSSSAAARRVLLVEDEALVAMLLADNIESAGFKVEQANDGTVALSLIERLPQLDSAVVNLRLRCGPDGKQVIRALRARWASLPIIVVTGYMPSVPEADLRGLGGPTVRLHKPVDMDELGSHLASLSADGWRGRDTFKRSRRKGEGEAGASSRLSQPSY